MKVCFFGTYNRGHSANLIYASAVRAAGCELVECHEALWERTRDKRAGYFRPFAIPGHALRWARAALRLAVRWRAMGGAPVALIGFNGQLDILLLRVLTLRYGPRIVFAPLVSLTETLVDDRRVYRAGSLAARVLRWIDRLSCRAADVVIADTEEHRRYFIERLGVCPARVAVCHLGVDNAAFAATLDARTDATGSPDAAVSAADDAERPSVEVLYFGQYLPLHGLDVVVDAVGRLAARRDLCFVFIGTGEERDRVEPLLRATRANVEFIDWVPYEELGGRIASADIVLGVFGASVKARMVIPNKVFEAAAVGRAVITADAPAVAEVFTDERDLLTCAADPAALAGAIERLADDPALRRRLGASSAALMAERFSDAAQAEAWSFPLGLTGERAERRFRVGVAIVNFNDAEATVRCLESLERTEGVSPEVLVLDSGSAPADRSRIERALADRPGVAFEALGRNLGYSGANNVALARLFGDGVDHVLVLNNDTIVTPGAIEALVLAAERDPGCGPIGPTVARDWPGAPPASVGERYWASLAWAPRSLLRYRRRRQSAYPVGGVMGCALLIPRPLYEALGGFDERYFAYYEEVDYCLGARASGWRVLVEPGAEIAHRGHRGFGSGMTPVAAYLKARNLWILGMRRTGVVGRVVFALGYAAMLGASASLYALRRRPAIVRALVGGARAGLAGETGEPPRWVFAASGIFGAIEGGQAL